MVYKFMTKYSYLGIDFKIYLLKTAKYLGDIERLFKIARRLPLHFSPTKKQSQPYQGDFFARITL
jgi:hypothetical protein